MAPHSVAKRQIGNDLIHGFLHIPFQKITLHKTHGRLPSQARRFYVFFGNFQSLAIDIYANKALAGLVLRLSINGPLNQQRTASAAGIQHDRARL